MLLNLDKGRVVVSRTELTQTSILEVCLSYYRHCTEKFVQLRSRVFVLKWMDGALGEICTVDPVSKFNICCSLGMLHVVYICYATLLARYR